MAVALIYKKESSTLPASPFRLRLPVNNLPLENTPFPPHKKRCWKTCLPTQAVPYNPPCSAIFFIEKLVRAKANKI